MKKKIILLLLILGASYYLYQLQQQPVETVPVVTEQTQEEINSQLLLTATIDDQTAYELLNSSADVTTKDYGDAGLFVTGINGVESNNEHYWAFYVNDNYAQQSVDQTILKAGDIVKFVYEEIQDTQL